jgi:hypothetical protein
MRELSDESALHQAQQFIAYGGDFDRWARSKDLGRADRRAVERAVLYLRGRHRHVAEEGYAGR